MKFKLDENLGPSIQRLFGNQHLDCHTVRDEGLSGATDGKVLDSAVSEQRILVTLDRDFGDVLRFPPEATAGIIVLAPIGRITPLILADLVNGVLKALKQNPVDGCLWIAEPGRIRQHSRKETD